MKQVKRKEFYAARAMEGMDKAKDLMLVIRDLD